MADIEYAFKDQDGYPNLVLISPNGSNWTVTVDDAGVLIVTAV